MALIKCSECKNMVSDQAEFCPHCGIKSPKADKDWLEEIEQEAVREQEMEEAKKTEVIKLKEAEDSFLNFLVMGSLIILVIVLITKLGSEPSAYQTSTNSNTGMWYEGGTLHKATVSDWKTATYENKLATAGDWIVATKWENAIREQSDMDEVKIEAQSLVHEIDTATSDNGIVNNMSLASIVTMIIIQRDDFGPHK